MPRSPSQPLVLGPFDVGEIIGRGGMGTVRRARHRTTRADVAIKFLGSTDDPARRDMFRREVQAHAGLVHPGIVYLFEYGEVPSDVAAGADTAPGSPYIAMEFARAGTIRDARVAAYAGVRDTVLQVLDALAFSHARGVIHRDLKPENLLVFENGQLKLADFGIAHSRRADDNQADDPGAIAGTPYYMAPEQIVGRWREFGPWTDFYALGCMVWELVSGRPPFTGPIVMRDVILRHVQAPRPALEPRFDVPATLDAWVQRAMAIDPLDRFASAAEAAMMLPLAPEPNAVIVRGPPAASVPTVSWSATTLALEELVRVPHSVAARREAPPITPICRDWRATWRAMPNQLVGTGLGLFGLREVPFVDRERERDELWNALAAASTGQGSEAAVLVGFPGTGKSRLADWLATRAQELGTVSVWHATHRPDGEGYADGLAGMLRRFLATWGEDRASFQERLERSLPPLPREDDRDGDIRALGHLLLEPDDPTAGPHRSAPAQRRALLTRTLRRYTQRGPALVVLDDVQWGSEALDWAESLLALVGGPRALVVMTVPTNALGDSADVRDRVAALEKQPRCIRINVQPLRGDDHRQLVERMLSLQGDLAADLARRTEGNPLFAIQLLGDLVERGGVEATESGFRLAGNSTLELPASVQQSWTKRIDRVAAEHAEGAALVWEAVELAATLGRDIADAEWRAVCDLLGIADIGPRDALVDRALARRHDNGWEFAHGLLVDSIVARAAGAGRAPGQHRRCAELLDAVDPSPASAARRAHHWIHAGEPIEALAALETEAERQRRAGGSRALADVNRQRRALMDEVRLPKADPRRLTLVFEEAFYDQFRGVPSAEIRNSVLAALELAEQTGDAALVAIGATQLAECERTLGNHQGAIAAGHRAAIAAWDSADIIALAAALDTLGWNEFLCGALDEAALHLGSSLELLSADPDPFRRLVVSYELAYVSLGRGDHGEAAARLTDVIAEARRESFRSIEADAANCLGDTARLAGDVELARECYERCDAIYAELERIDGTPAINLMLLDLQVEDLASASRRLKEGRRDFRQLFENTHGELTDMAELVIRAGSEKWAEYDEQLARFDGRWPEGAALGSDHPWLLEMAGDLAARAGFGDRAAMAWHFSRALWAQLGDTTAERRVLAKLEVLAP